MKIPLILKYKIIGFGRLKGIAYSRMKAVSKEESNNWQCNLMTSLKNKYGKYIPEYRLVREKEGYIWRNTLGDSGISGHHKTVRSAIISALWYVDIYIDEDFCYTEYPEFQKLEYQHKNKFKCKHPNFRHYRDYKECTECGYREISKDVFNSNIIKNERIRRKI